MNQVNVKANPGCCLILVILLIIGILSVLKILWSLL